VDEKDVTYALGATVVLVDVAVAVLESTIVCTSVIVEKSVSMVMDVDVVEYVEVSVAIWQKAS